MKIIGGSALRTPEFHKKKEREMWGRRLLFILLILALIGVPTYLLLDKNYLISSIEIQGNDVTQNEEIEKIASAELSGKYFFIFPRSHAFLYPKAAITRDLLQNIPRLKSATLSLNNPRSLLITVEERDPAALYCADVSNLLSPTGCYFMDAEGLIFAPAPTFSSGVYQVYSSDPTLADPLGKQFISGAEFKKFPDFLKILSGIGIYPQAFLVKDGEYNLILASGAPVMFKSDKDLSEILVNLESFFSEAEIKNSKNFLERILYLDMRFDNKIFYKFRD